MVNKYNDRYDEELCECEFAYLNGTRFRGNSGDSSLYRVTIKVSIRRRDGNAEFSFLGSPYARANLARSNPMKYDVGLIRREGREGVPRFSRDHRTSGRMRKQPLKEEDQKEEDDHVAGIAGERAGMEFGRARFPVIRDSSPRIRGRALGTRHIIDRSFDGCRDASLRSIATLGES